MAADTLFLAGRSPWHDLGVRITEGDVTAAEAIQAAKLDWRVEKRALFADVGTDQFTQIEDQYAIVRSDTLEPISIVGEGYHPIQNTTSFDLMDLAVGQGKAVYHTAGSLNGGRRVWILVQLPGEIRVKHDITEKFLLLSNSHDGSSLLRMFLTPIRVVCQNTLNLALSRAGDDGVSIRHTANADAKIREAKRAMEIAASYYDAFEVDAKRMGAAKYNDKQVAALASHIFPAKDDAEDAEPAAVTIKNRERIIELYEVGQGHKEIAGTAWAAFNAVAEWTDHHRANRTDENRLRSAWFGRGAKIKRRAHEYIMAELERKPKQPRPRLKSLTA
jgi:phage/plasmid-like protein (TIGR03299 family)